MSTPYYTIVVSGESFRLTRKQLLSEPDNLFEEMTEAYQGGDQIEIENEPLLFKLLQAHLRGHDILPIPDGYISYMTKEGVLKNLLKLAEEYGLDILAGKIKAFQATQARSQPHVSQRKYMLKRFRPAKEQAHYQYLGKEEYLAIFHGVAANSNTGQYLVISDSKLQHLREDGYSVSMSWGIDQNQYALLVSGELYVSEKAIQKPAIQRPAPGRNPFRI